jgi:hypothetical protein
MLARGLPGEGATSNPSLGDIGVGVGILFGS